MSGSAATASARRRRREAETRVARAKQARRRLAEAEAALASNGWTPTGPRTKSSLPPSARSTDRAAPRPPPVERPDELPEARETIAALKASRRRLAKEVQALDDLAGSGALSELGRTSFSKTRLVTVRLVDERLAAEGKTPDHRDVIRLASAAGLKHPEALVWPGGLRVVFSEESVLPPSANPKQPQQPPGMMAAERAGAIKHLADQLSELHGQQLAFFLAMLDAKLGFDTAASASVQRQADHEKANGAVPPALPPPPSRASPRAAAADGAGGTGGRHVAPEQIAGFPSSPQTPLTAPPNAPRGVGKAYDA